MISDAPEDVICKHEFYFRMFAKNCFYWLMSPNTNVDNGSGGKCNSGIFIFLPTQHSLEVSFLNFNAQQNVHNLFIFSIITLR